MSLLDAVKNLVSDWEMRAEIRRTRIAWINFDVHKFRSPGIERLGRVAGEIKAMDEQLERLRRRDRSRR